MLRRWATGTIALIAVLAAVTSLAYRSAYGSWWQAPQRITYCARTYLAGATDLTLADVQRQVSRTALPGDQPYSLATIGTVPPIVGQPMLAAVTPEAARRKLGVPCAMVIYLKTGADSYTAYTLSGGP